MKFELDKAPFLFAAGFNVDTRNHTPDQYLALNALLDDLFNQRFHPSFTMLGQPQFNTVSAQSPEMHTDTLEMSFRCTLTTQSLDPNAKLQASIETNFIFSCKDVQINDFKLRCTSVGCLKIIDLENPTLPKVMPYSKWANSLISDQIYRLYINLVNLLNDNPVRMEKYFNAGGLDLFREYEDYQDSLRKMDSTYYVVKTALTSPAVEVEETYIVRSLQIKQSDNTELLKKSYEVIGDELKLICPVLGNQASLGFQSDAYQAVNLHQSPECVHDDDFQMSNSGCTAMFKIVGIQPTTLSDLKAADKLIPKVLDLDLAIEVGI